MSQLAKKLLKNRFTSNKFNFLVRWRYQLSCFDVSCWLRKKRKKVVTFGLVYS